MKIIDVLENELRWFSGAVGNILYPLLLLWVIFFERRENMYWDFHGYLVKTVLTRNLSVTVLSCSSSYMTSPSTTGRDLAWGLEHLVEMQKVSDSISSIIPTGKRRDVDCQSLGCMDDGTTQRKEISFVVSLTLDTAL